MPYVLDYSNRVGPAFVAAAKLGYVGAVRYGGTPGNAKNLTPSEADAWLAAPAHPLALVYETTAGWVLGGAPAGRAAGRALLADAGRCGIGLRAGYLAVDIDITSEAQMRAVEQCLNGAAEVLGRARVGVYGEYDVIQRMLGRKLAAWGWQTRAWSGGRTSSLAHIRQEIGYVYPGGVQCDRSTVLKPDWGGWLPDTTPDGGITMADADSLSRQVADLSAKFDQVVKLLTVGDAPDRDGDAGTHPNNLERVMSVIDALSKLEKSDAAAIGARLAELAQTQGLLGAQLRDLSDQVSSIKLAAGDPGATAAALQELLERARYVFERDSDPATPGGSA